MIKLQFSAAVALYILVVLGGTFIFWLYSELKKKQHSSSLQKNLWKCPICTGVYREKDDKQISQCPHCQSFNKRDERK